MNLPMRVYVSSLWPLKQMPKGDYKKGEDVENNLIFVGLAGYA